jgi:hypothetical protein
MFPGAGILRPFFAAAQRPYIPTLVPFNRAIELQGGHSAEHFCHRKLQLPGDLVGA